MTIDIITNPSAETAQRTGALRVLRSIGHPPGFRGGYRHRLQEEWQVDFEDPDHPGEYMKRRTRIEWRDVPVVDVSPEEFMTNYDMSQPGVF